MMALVWTRKVSRFNGSTLGYEAHAGTFRAALFSVEYSVAGPRDTPWRLTTTLPGYDHRKWRFADEREAQDAALRVLARFVERVTGDEGIGTVNVRRYEEVGG